MWAVNHVVLVQQAHNVVVHALLGRVPGQPVQVVGDVTVRVMVQEDLGRLEAALPGCQEQRSLLL